MRLSTLRRQGQIVRSPHSVAVAVREPSRLTSAAKKLLRKKKNESWAMRRLENIRGLTSPTLGVGGNLLCKIVQFGLLGVARASRVQMPVRLGLSASRRNSLFLTQASRAVAVSKKSPRSRDALASTRDGCATQSDSLRYSCFAPRRLLRAGSHRRLLRRLKQRWSQSSSLRRVSIFHSINRPPL